jgi:hypothetical protein
MRNESGSKHRPVLRVVPQRAESVDTALAGLYFGKVLVGRFVMLMMLLMLLMMSMMTMSDQMAAGMVSTEEVGEWRSVKTAFRAGAGKCALAPVQPGKSRIGLDGRGVARTLSGGPPP